MEEIPKLVPLKYGSPYCEECEEELKPGMRVAWWRVSLANGGTRLGVHCAACHHAKTTVRKTNRRRRRRAA